MTQKRETFELYLSEDLETEGFDIEAGKTWIYPTNYPFRNYQFNIVQQALLKNTLVSLPTGLGKTFIAAVVMYNFYRWYPLGKIIFMAPTRPLVKQQIEACYDIMAIPKDVTVELTGTKLSSSRENIWKEKRVFFITPQILQNDLEKLVELGKQIKCLVFDEAHRARGNHAYCEVIRKLVPCNKYFRVLALSATPGSTVGDVSEVVQNLLISHLEFRTEESLDVHPYVFERNLTTIVVPLGEKLQQIRDDYLQVLEYYTRTLVKYKVVQGNCGNLTKGKIFMTLKEFQQKTRNSGSSNYGEIMKSLNICVTLYHGFELLIRHGLRSFLSFFNEHIGKPLLRGNTHLVEIMNDIQEYIGPDPVVEQLPDGSFVEIPKTSKFGHPKFYKLRDILVSHFAMENESSRVIVFFEYRNSVMEAYALLNQARPFLRPRIFLGQGRGVTQRQQLNVVKSFKEGECNILLSTCIGEEGLDVGDVDLIVCFDISNKSPIRMVQRMGRTGRKKEGHVVVLVTEGKEQQILKDCLMHKNNIAVHVLSSKELAKGLNTNSPRLVPPEIEPKCDKMYITVKKPPLSKKSSLKEMFQNISNKSSEPHFPPDLQIVDIKDRIPSPKNLWNKENPLNKNLLLSNIFSKKVEKQRTFQSSHLVKHSSNTELLVNLLQHVDSKRFNLPTTQIGHSQLTQNKNLKQSDIRNMFLKSQSSNEFLPGTQVQKMSFKPLDSTEDNSSLHSKKLLSEISDYLLIDMLSDSRKCKHCPDNFDCNNFNIASDSKEIIWPQQDESILNVTLEDLQTFFEYHILKSDKHDTEDSLKANTPYNQNDIVQQCPEEKKLEIDESPVISQFEKTCTYEAPKTLDFLLNKYSTSIADVDEFATEVEKINAVKQTPKTPVKLDFENTSGDLLNFFKLNSLEDLFVCSDSQETIIYSPDIIENSFVIKVNTSESDNDIRQYNVSPVLCTFERVKNIKNSHKILFKSNEDSNNSTKSTVSNNETIHTNKPNLKKLKLHHLSGSRKGTDTPTKFSVSLKSCSTPLCYKSHEKNNSEFFGECSSQKKDLRSGKHESNKLENSDSINKGPVENIDHNIDIDDLCDLEVFGLTCTGNVLNEPQSNLENLTNTNILIENCVDDICDLSVFGIDSQIKKYPVLKNNMEKNIHITKEIDKKYEITNFSKADSCSTKQNSSEHDISKYQKYTRAVPSTLPLQTQMSITQIIDLVNTDEKGKKESLDNVEMYNLGKEDKKKLIFSPKKKTNNELNYLNTNKSLQKSLKDPNLKKRHGDNNKEFKVPNYMELNATLKLHSGNKSIATKKKYTNPFIENEAELSIDEHINISGDEDDEEQNFFEGSFINDDTQNMDTQMHIQYLQTTRSPRNQNKYKIPRKPNCLKSIYSQEVHGDDTYLNDSFVVHDESEGEQHELSELEILEEKLRRRKKKRSRSDDIVEHVKRKRIKQLLSDDSD